MEWLEDEEHLMVDGLLVCKGIWWMKNLSLELFFEYFWAASSSFSFLRDQLWFLVCSAPLISSSTQKVTKTGTLILIIHHNLTTSASNHANSAYNDERMRAIKQINKEQENEKMKVIGNKRKKLLIMRLFCDDKNH